MNSENLVDILRTHYHQFDREVHGALQSSDSNTLRRLLDLLGQFSDTVTEVCS